VVLWLHVAGAVRGEPCTNWEAAWQHLHSSPATHTPSLALTFARTSIVSQGARGGEEIQVAALLTQNRAFEGEDTNG
jgi:hypothetical protein